MGLAGYVAGQAVPTITADHTENVSGATDLDISWDKPVTGFEVGDVTVSGVVPAVSNLNTAFSNTFQSQIQGDPIVAQKFTAGGGNADHTLKRVEIDVVSLSTDVTVTINAVSDDGNPGNVVHTLMNPAILTGFTIKTFTAPANAMLTPDTEYFIVFDGSSGLTNLNLSDVGTQDVGAASGWSIDNRYLHKNNGSWAGAATGEDAIRIAIIADTGITPEVGTITNFSAVSSTSYTATYTPPGPNKIGTDEISIAAGVAQDLDGNDNTAIDVLTITYDTELGTITLSETTRTVNEGGTATYTVVLDGQPTHIVDVRITSGNTDAVTVSPATLVFDTNNWATPQTVTVTGVNDADGDDATVTISHAATSVDNTYAISDAGTVSVTVTDVNAAPSVPSLTEAANAPGGVSYGSNTVTIAAAIAAGDALLTAASTDPDGDAVTYSLEAVAPSGTGLLDTLGIDASSGIITLKVALTAADNDRHAFKVIASDGDLSAETATQVLAIDIPPNVAPSVPTLTEAATAPDGVSYGNDVLTISATIAVDDALLTAASTDPEGEPVTYRLEAVAPSGAGLLDTLGIDATSGIITLKVALTAADNDRHAFKVIASDGDLSAETATQVLAIDIPPNVAPSVPTLTEAATAPDGVSYGNDMLTIAEDVAINDALLTAESIDPEGENVTYRLEAVAPSGAGLLDTLGIDASSGIITLKVDLTAADNDRHAFKVVASDGDLSAETATQVLAIDIPPNEAPSVPALTEAANAPDGVSYGSNTVTIAAAIAINDALLTAESIDPEGEPVMYSLEAVAPSGAGLLDTLGIDATSGIITLKVDLTAADNDRHAFKVVASDGDLSAETATQILEIDIPPNEAPSVPALMEAATAPDGVSYGNETVTIAANVAVGDALITAASTDPEGEPVTYRLEAVAPSGAGLLDTLGIDATSGIITLKVALTAADNGTHTFKVVASDGDLMAETVTQTLAIDIGESTIGNVAPSIPALMEAANAPEGVGYGNETVTIAADVAVDDALLTAESTDPEGEPVTYSLEAVAPSGAELLDTLAIDASTGIITLKVALTASDNGTHTFKVVASDGDLMAETVTQTLAIAIDDDEVVEPPLGLSDADGYAVYPNPVGGNESLRILAAQSGDRVEMVDLEGHLLISRTLRSGNEQLSVANLPAGAYLVIITPANGNATKSTVLRFVRE